METARKIPCSTTLLVLICSVVEDLGFDLALELLSAANLSNAYVEAQRIDHEGCRPGSIETDTC